jgi:hypothetical protein
LLQTSIVSYKKKYPWSLSKPSFQVSLKFVSFLFLLNWVYLISC